MSLYTQFKSLVTEAQLYEIYRPLLEFDQVYSNASYDPVFNQQIMSAAFRAPWNVDRAEFDALGENGGMLSGHASRFANLDAIYLYGRGVRNAIDSALDFRNSAVMRQVFRNISFDGKSGRFAINHDGKRYSRFDAVRASAGLLRKASAEAI